MKHKTNWIVLCAATVVIGMYAWSGEAAEDAPAMRAGVASMDITPEMPIRLSGYAARQEEAQEVEQPLYAKALALDADGAPLSVLITADLIAVPAWITEELAQRLEEQAGLEPAQLAICATHTHAGPVVRRSIPDLFGEDLPDDEQGRIDRYAETLVDKLEAVALEAAGNLSEARLAWGQGSVDFAMNRRVLEDGQWTGFGAVPEGPVDHDVPVLSVTDPEGGLHAVFVNYACHCTTLTGQFNVVHGDWAGEAAARLEEAHDGAIALIAIGCGADANPHPRAELEHTAQHGQTLAEEVNEVLAGKLTPIHHAPLGEIRTVSLPFAEQDAALEYPIQTWTFGDELAMVFLPGEVTVDYALRLKDELDRRRLWVNAYANDVPCYIASSRVIEEGGYEVDRSMDFYGQPGPFSPEIEDIIIGAVHDMLTPAFERPEREPVERVEGNEPRLITPEDDGSLRLTAAAGSPYGQRIEYMPEWEAFGWWRDDDHVEWEVEVPETGRYEVWMEWSVSDASAGNPYVFVANQRVLRGFIQPTGGWEEFDTAKIGELTLPAGRHTMAMKSASEYEEALMDLREIRLTPVE